MKHIAIVGILTIIATVLLGLLFQSIDLLPAVASAEGLIVDDMFALQFWIIAFLFSLIVVFMLYSVVVFRRKPGEEEEDGDYFSGNTGLEITWTAIPLIVVLLLGGLGAKNLTTILSPSEEELTVQVTGFQFGWRFDYPGFDITSNTLNLPIDRKIHLELTSLDVIHSFWVPEFRVKQDALPGTTTHLRFTPTKLGIFTLRCTELCGLAHTYMLADVIVMESDAFNTWVDAEREAFAPDEPAAIRGDRIFEINCASCHSVDGSLGVGPTFLGSFGTERLLESGEMVEMDKDYVRQSILNPGLQIVNGYTNIMPAAYRETLSDQEIEALIDLIAGLGESTAEQPEGE